MFNNISFQGVLFALQCLLIAWLFTAQSGGIDHRSEQQPLLAATKSALNTITIIDSDKNKVLLKKEGDRWVLPDYHNLSVDQGLLDRMLEKVTNAETSWPIAQKVDAQERFQVSANKFKRHLKLQAEADAATNIYLGDSPGLRKTYARIENAAAIYAIEFGLHLAPANAEQWFDKNLLKPEGEVKEIQAPGFVLYKESDGWNMRDLAELESLDQDKIVNLVNYFQYPQVQKVAYDELVSKVKESKPLSLYQIKTGDTDITYELFKVDKQHVLKTSQSDLCFIVGDFVADTFSTLKRKDIIKKAEPDVEVVQPDSAES